MTVGFSQTNTVNAFLNALRGNANFTAFAGTFAKLHIGDPGSAGTANAAAGSTSRPSVTLGAPSGSAVALTNSPQWTNGGTSETVTHISLWDAASAGNFICSIALTASKAWASGDTLTLTSCGISMSPTAA